MLSTDFDVDVAAVRARSTMKWDGVPEGTLAAAVAEMDFGVAPVVRAALEAAVECSALGYPAPSAVRALADVFAERAARRFGWPVDAERVSAVTDVITGMTLALEELTDPGDAVVVITPAYPPYFFAIEGIGRRPVACPMVLDGEGWVVDLDALHAVAADSAALVVCNPHNPTGRCFTPAELAALAAVADRHGLFVVADEIHGDLVYPGAIHTPFSLVGDDAGRGHVILTSASKGFNLSGLRCAMAVASSPAVHDALNRRQFFARPGVSRLAVSACAAAWTAGDPWLDAVVEYLADNRRWLFEELAVQVPGLVGTAPEATYLAWLDCRSVDGHDPAARALASGVALNPGAWFGPGWEGFVRLNFATSRPVLAEMVSRLASAFA